MSRRAEVKKTSVEFTDCITLKGLGRKELDIRNKIRKEEVEDSDRHFVHQTSGMSSEQLKDYAVVGIFWESRTEIGSQELIEVGHNNSSLTLEATSVVTSEMGTKLNRLVPICVFIQTELLLDLAQ